MFFLLSLTASAQNPSAVIANGDQFYCTGQLPIVEGSVTISDPSDPLRTTLMRYTFRFLRDMKEIVTFFL